MPEKTKITLSDKERSLVKNVDWILTKQVIIQKVYDLFGSMIPVIHAAVLQNEGLPETVRTSVPKINKGENYLRLPYVILDYPRCFDKEDILAVRTMFWWGNFMSVTLHVAGQYKELVKDNLYADLPLSVEGLYIGVNENQWQHHFEEDNFVPYTRLASQQRVELFEKNNFIKLAVKFPLDEWDHMPELLEKAYKNICGILINCPNGETGL